MQAKAVSRYVRVSALKVLKVSSAVKGKPVGAALSILKFMPQKAAKTLEKVLRSAVANADQKPDVDVDRLIVRTSPGNLAQIRSVLEAVDLSDLVSESLTLNRAFAERFKVRLVASGEPCLGPVTHAGCGALCPSYNRGCYGCFGPQEAPNAAAARIFARSVTWFPLPNASQNVPV